MTTCISKSSFFVLLPIALVGLSIQSMEQAITVTSNSIAIETQNNQTVLDVTFNDTGIVYSLDEPLALVEVPIESR